MQDLSILWSDPTNFIEISKSLPQFINSAHWSITFTNVIFSSKDSQELFDNAVNVKILKITDCSMDFDDTFELNSTTVYKLEELKLSIQANFKFQVCGFALKTAKFIKTLGDSTLPKSLKKLSINIKKLKAEFLYEILSKSNFKQFA